MFLHTILLCAALLPGSTAQCTGGQCEDNGDNMLQIHSAELQQQDGGCQKQQWGCDPGWKSQCCDNLFCNYSKPKGTVMGTCEPKPTGATCTNAIISGYSIHDVPVDCDFFDDNFLRHWCFHPVLQQACPKTCGVCEKDASGKKCQEENWGCSPGWKSRCCDGMFCDLSKPHPRGGTGTCRSRSNAKPCTDGATSGYKARGTPFACSYFDRPAFRHWCYNPVLQKNCPKTCDVCVPGFAVGDSVACDGSKACITRINGSIFTLDYNDYINSATTVNPDEGDCLGDLSIVTQNDDWCKTVSDFKEWAVRALQLRGSQDDYDKVLAKPYDERRAEYERIRAQVEADLGDDDRTNAVALVGVELGDLELDNETDA